MKQFKLLNLLLVIIASTFALSACSNDDEPGDLDSYIIGTWRTYKLVGYLENGGGLIKDGEPIETDISKNGAHSEVYIEFTFEKNGIVTGGKWETDNNGLSTWFTNTGEYKINGNMVEVDFGYSPATLYYNEDDHSLYIRGGKNTDAYGYMSVYICLRK